MRDLKRYNTGRVLLFPLYIEVFMFGWFFFYIYDNSQWHFTVLHIYMFQTDISMLCEIHINFLNLESTVLKYSVKEQDRF